MTIVVATTMAPYVCDRAETSTAWLRNAEAMIASSPDVRFFAALEVDSRGLAPFDEVTERLTEVGGSWFTWSLDDGSCEVTTGNRLRRITMGQNLCSDYATDARAEWLLFLAADLEPPGDAIPKLLEMEWPLVGGEVTTYCLDGPRVEGYPFPVTEQMATAAFVMLRRDVFTRLKWRWDSEMSDDPCLQHDAKTLLGIPTRVRKDCVGLHHPLHVTAIESRYPGRDLSRH